MKRRKVTWTVTLADILRASIFADIIRTAMLAFVLFILAAPYVQIKENPLTLAEVDQIISVACGSDSMGMSLDCNDKLYVRELKQTEHPIEGRIYVFKSPYGNVTTVHRLVKCMDNCSRLIFKGDNNKIADPIINRSDILYEVMKVEYR